MHCEMAGFEPRGNEEASDDDELSDNNEVFDDFYCDASLSSEEEQEVDDDEEGREDEEATVLQTCGAGMCEVSLMPAPDWLEQARQRRSETSALHCAAAASSRFSLLLDEADLDPNCLVLGLRASDVTTLADGPSELRLLADWGPPPSSWFPGADPQLLEGWRVKKSVSALASSLGASVDQLGFALYNCALVGNLFWVRWLLAEGVNPNMRFRSVTPLYVATHGNHVAVVDELIAAHARIDSRTPTGWTALHCASAMGHSECIQHLLRAGASTSKVTSAGHTPLDVAKSSALAFPVMCELQPPSTAEVGAGVEGALVHILSHRCKLPAHQAVVAAMACDALATLAALSILHLPSDSRLRYDVVAPAWRHAIALMILWRTCGEYDRCWHQIVRTWSMRRHSAFMHCRISDVRPRRLLHILTVVSSALWAATSCSDYYLDTLGAGIFHLVYGITFLLWKQPNAALSPIVQSRAWELRLIAYLLCEPQSWASSIFQLLMIWVALLRDTPLWKAGESWVPTLPSQVDVLPCMDRSLYARLLVAMGNQVLAMSHRLVSVLRAASSLEAQPSNGVAVTCTLLVAWLLISPPHGTQPGWRPMRAACLVGLTVAAAQLLALAGLLSGAISMHAQRCAAAPAVCVALLVEMRSINWQRKRRYIRVYVLALASWFKSIALRLVHVACRHGHLPPSLIETCRMLVWPTDHLPSEANAKDMLMFGVDNRLGQLMASRGLRSGDVLQLARDSNQNGIDRLTEETNQSIAACVVMFHAGESLCVYWLSHESSGTLTMLRRVNACIAAFKVASSPSASEHLCTTDAAMLDYLLGGICLLLSPDSARLNDAFQGSSALELCRAIETLITSLAADSTLQAHTSVTFAACYLPAALASALFAAGLSPEACPENAWQVQMLPSNHLPTTSSPLAWR